MEHKKRIFPRLFGKKRPSRKRRLEKVEEPAIPAAIPQMEVKEEQFNPIWDTNLLDRPALSDVRIPAPRAASDYSSRGGAGTIHHGENETLNTESGQLTAVAPSYTPQTDTLETPNKDSHLDDIVDQLLRDKDFLLSKELKHKADEINQLLVQAQRQNLKVEVNASQVEASPGKTLSWLDVKIYKEI